MQLDALAFGAHPDDVELACAGTLIKLFSNGYKTGAMALTDGELGTRGTREIRCQEFGNSAQVMGLARHGTLGLPDGHIELNWENKLKLIGEIRKSRPHIIFAPYWQDRHPDHEKASELVRTSCFLSGLKKVNTDQEPHRPCKILYYPCRFEFRPSFIVDVTEFHERKLQAIQNYESQFHNPNKEQYGPEETNISRPDFLEAIIARDKKYGCDVGVGYGEAFLVRGPVKLEDPIAFFGNDSLDGFL